MEGGGQVNLGGAKDGGRSHTPGLALAEEIFPCREEWEKDDSTIVDFFRFEW